MARLRLQVQLLLVPALISNPAQPLLPVIIPLAPMAVFGIPAAAPMAATVRLPRPLPLPGRLIKRLAPAGLISGATTPVR